VLQAEVNPPGRSRERRAPAGIYFGTRSRGRMMTQLRTSVQTLTASLSCRPLLLSLALLTALSPAVLADTGDQLALVTSSVNNQDYPTACSTLGDVYSSTNGFSDIPIDDLQSYSGTGNGDAWIAAAQAAQTAENHAYACAAYFLGVAAYRADGNINMANIWSSTAISESNKVTAANTTQTTTTTGDGSTDALIGDYGCFSYQTYGLTNSSMPTMRITSGSTYDALGQSGTFDYSPMTPTSTSDIIGRLNFRDGGLTGYTGYANLKANGDRAIIFDAGVLDLGTTWCYGPK
jgi:hypothetical protein